MARPSLLEVRNSALPWLGAQVLTLHDNHLELSTSAVGGSDVESISYKQLARVLVSPSLMSTDLILETTGGGSLRMLGLRRKQAQEVRVFLLDRLYPNDDAPTLTYL